MRLSVLAAALFASAAMAESTVYTTEIVTITSCAPTVTNCPARSTVLHTTSYPVVTSSQSPAYSNTTWTSSAAPPPPPPHTSSSGPGPQLSTITISTCIPTVLYSVVTVQPTPTSSVVAVGTGAAHPSQNGTATTSSSAQFTGAASNVKGSMAIAAAGGLAAFLLA